MADMKILMWAAAFFVLLGAVVPYINSEFGSDYSGNELDDPSGEGVEASSALFTSLLNVLTFAFWTFGLPSWFNLMILLPIRVVLIILGIRYIPVVGSG